MKKELEALLTARLDLISEQTVNNGLQLSEHTNKLTNLEEKMTDMQEDVSDLKNGPVGQLNRYINHQIAKVTGGVGLFGLFLFIVTGGGL